MGVRVLPFQLLFLLLQANKNRAKCLPDFTCPDFTDMAFCRGFSRCSDIRAR